MIVEDVQSIELHSSSSERRTEVFDRDNILTRINGVLDRGTCTLQTVMAEFNLTTNGCELYEAVRAELTTVAKLKHGGILVRRKKAKAAPCSN